MRKCNNILRYKAVIDGVDRVISIPSIVDKGTIFIAEGRYFNTEDNQIICTVGYSMIDVIKYITEFDSATRFVLNGGTWKTLGIDNVSSVIFEEQGIIYIKLQRDLKIAEDDFTTGLAFNKKTPAITTPIGDGSTIKLPTNIISIEQSKKFQIIAVCRNNNMIVTSPILNYNVTDNTICKVDFEGLVTGLKEGATTIVINYNDEEVILNITITHSIVVPIITYNIVASQGSNINYINTEAVKSYKMQDQNNVDVVGFNFTFSLEQSELNSLITPQEIISNLVSVTSISTKLTASSVKGHFYLVATCNENGVTTKRDLRVKGTFNI